MQALNIAIELSDLFEQAEVEGGLVASLIDEEIMPVIRQGLNEGSFEIGLGDRFNRVIDKVRLSADRTGKDRIRTLKDMLRSALSTYVRKTNDAITARGAYNHSIRSGSDMMLAVAAAAILANALSGSHSKEAQSLMQKVVSRLSGPQKRVAVENASGAAVGAGAIATAVTGRDKKKRRKDTIFAEAEMNPFPKSQTQAHAEKRMGEPMINEDVTPLPGMAQQPVQNPSLSAADDPSNVYMLRPQSKLFHDKPQTDTFWITLFLPREGEQNMRGALQDVLELAQHYGMTSFDKRNGIFYAHSNTTGTVPTMQIRGPAQQPIDPFQLARIAAAISQAQPAQTESVTWDDLIGNPSAMDVLNEVAHSGNPRRHDGVLVDPTTAELVLCVHRSLTPENQQRYREKPLARMIAIAERAVQRGLIEVVMEEA